MLKYKAPTFPDSVTAHMGLHKHLFYRIQVSVFRVVYFQVSHQMSVANQ